MEYYDINDVIKMTGVKKNKGYEIIRELNEKFKKKFPLAIIIQGKVRKDFYDSAMGKKEENNEAKREF